MKGLMGKQVELLHRTRYRYSRAVSLGPQVIQLRPAPHSRTAILSYSLEVLPAEHILHWQFDPLGNHLARLVFSGKTEEFRVEVRLVADLEPVNPFAFFLEPGFEQYPFAYSADLARDLIPYSSREFAGPLLRGFLNEISQEPQGTVGLLVDLNRRVRDRVEYTTRMEHGVQTPEETLGLGTGSCRDSAWLLVQMLRHLGFAARFVSGYLIQLAESKPVTAEPARDSADLHAWAEVYLPGAGWIGLDATSGLLTGEGHIPLVCTPTAAQAAPIGGTVERAEVDFSYTMEVRRLNEAPQLSRPYSDEDWDRVRAVAHRIDREVETEDVRMTMGGEPTYVGIDDPESGQWNLTALGAMKRTRGLSLLREIRNKTAPGGLLHFGQGKWYPGEALPRWAFHCVSRKDGVAVWEDVALIALEEQDYSTTNADAQQFVRALCSRLEVSSGNVLPAFDSGEPGAQPTGFVLPLRRRQPGGRLAWSSQLWFERPERLTLAYGDSPIGYRIPVEVMPFVAPDELEYEVEGESEKLTERVKLPVAPVRRRDLFGVEAAPDPLPPLSSTAETATELIRPSLCVEVRENRLHVFLPYVAVLADYLDLVAAIEDTCRFLGMAIWIEGYPPPYDSRLVMFSLTPDPGVLEVNLPPAKTWDELETTAKLLDDAAAANRLITGKFMHDGAHQATGGGSHIVIGAATVADSPVLRRPDVLRSMLAFWQNHPSLSYLFSGLYVGPTSQYPRVDEARVDALYELEVAFAHLPDEPCPPYIVDGLFRNLLVDVTGNTHRAEFCIDKMYPPEGQGLRAGLLELRAFEMAPHYRMGLMQMLLVRALLVMFWKQPFTGGLLRWGTTLHDRFMLPHFVEQDFAEVLKVLREAGYEFEDRWFAAQMEFRFPKIGSLAADGVEMELRQALEPWNVLAEETHSGNTVRSVDSSLERMQVKVRGLTTEGRYIVTCNGRRVPLHKTGVPGEEVAGIRYRARRLNATLHPSIPVHTPLVFELVDSWKRVSLGRCSYFVGRPDGELYEGRPQDAEEAKSRRMQRFELSEASGGTVTLPEEEKNPVFPMTLDLRWPTPGGTVSRTASGQEL